jgi:hypothetical protein
MSIPSCLTNLAKKVFADNAQPDAQQGNGNISVTGEHNTINISDSKTPAEPDIEDRVKKLEEKTIDTIKVNGKEI